MGNQQPKTKQNYQVYDKVQNLDFPKETATSLKKPLNQDFSEIVFTFDPKVISKNQSAISCISPPKSSCVSEIQVKSGIYVVENGPHEEEMEIRTSKMSTIMELTQSRRAISMIPQASQKIPSKIDDENQETYDIRLTQLTQKQPINDFFRLVPSTISGIGSSQKTFTIEDEIRCQYRQQKQTPKNIQNPEDQPSLILAKNRKSLLVHNKRISLQTTEESVMEDSCSMFFGFQVEKILPKFVTSIFSTKNDEEELENY